MSAIAPFETQFAHDIHAQRYLHPNDGDWAGTARRVVGSVVPALYYAPKARSFVGTIEELTRSNDALVGARRFVPGGRYLYSAGRDLHQINNCVLLRADDSREGWAALGWKTDMATMTGAGIGVWYGDVRAAGAPIGRTGGKSSGPLGLMQMTNDKGRHLMQGGDRRSANWAGLPWWHADVFAFMTSKDWPEWLREKKAEDWNVAAPMDMTNISVTLDDAFFQCYRDVRHRAAMPTSYSPDGGDWHDWAVRVYETAVAHMLRHGEPGFTVDCGDNSSYCLRNACTEICSADDGDVCNLGSLVLPRFDTPKQFGRAVRDAVGFLTAGTLYSDVPYRGVDAPRGNAGVDDVRSKNRRLGLGLIGVHEFVMQRGAKYGSDDALATLEPYYEEYARATEYAWDLQDALGLSRSKATRAFAPNGTIGIIAESTPSGDMMLCPSEIREVKSANVHGPDTFTSHVVVDPVAARLRAQGVDPELIEGALTCDDTERKLRQLVFSQRYVDQCISTTLNLPAVVTEPSEVRAFGALLMRYLPNLRGIAVYPTGARAGQPRNPVDLEWALAHQAVLETDANTCNGGTCGI